MRSHKNSDSYQWVTFLEHWGFLIVVFAVGLATQELMIFFLNLTGTAWVCFLAGSFVLMISGASVVVYAKWPAYRNGRFLTFGIKSVPEHLARHYRWGWRFFAAGTVAALCLLLSRHGVV